MISYVPQTAAKPSSLDGSDLSQASRPRWQNLRSTRAILHKSQPRHLNGILILTGTGFENQNARASLVRVLLLFLESCTLTGGHLALGLGVLRLRDNAAL